MTNPSASTTGSAPASTTDTSSTTPTASEPAPGPDLVPVGAPSAPVVVPVDPDSTSMHQPRRRRRPLGLFQILRQSHRLRPLDHHRPLARRQPLQNRLLRQHTSVWLLWHLRLTLLRPENDFVSFSPHEKHFANVRIRVACKQTNHTG